MTARWSLDISQGAPKNSPPNPDLTQEGNSDSRFASTTYLRTKREVENIDAIAIDQESVQGE